MFISWVFVDFFSGDSDSLPQRKKITRLQKPFFFSHVFTVSGIFSFSRRSGAADPRPPCLIELRSRQLSSLPGCLLFNSRRLRRTAENLRRSHSRPRALPHASACLCHRMRSAGRLRQAMVLPVFHSAGGHALPKTSCGIRVYVPSATAGPLVAECCRTPTGGAAGASPHLSSNCFESV